MAIVKVTMYNCDYTDIEKIILEHFGSAYEIMPMEEVGSSQYAATMTLNVYKAAITPPEQTDIDAMFAGEPRQYSLHSLLKELANNDKLPEGRYNVDVSW